MTYVEHMIWPLTVLLVALFCLHRARETFDPVVKSVVGSIAVQAQNQAGRWAIAMMFGLSASLAAFYDVFSQVTKQDFDLMSTWQFLSLLAKVANPFIVAALASAMPPGAKNPPPSIPPTTP